MLLHIAIHLTGITHHAAHWVAMHHGRPKLKGMHYHGRPKLSGVYYHD